MSLLAAMREVDSSSELNRYSESRPIMVDGSLSEVLTQALNIAYSKKDMTSGEPFYGHQNANGEPPRGAGNIPDIFEPDSPRDAVVKPDLQGMQQMQESEAAGIASMLGEVIDANRPREGLMQDKPMLVYAIP